MKDGIITECLRVAAFFYSSKRGTCVMSARQPISVTLHKFQDPGLLGVIHFNLHGSGTAGTSQQMTHPPKDVNLITIHIDFDVVGGLDLT